MNRLIQYQVTALRFVLAGVLACFFISPIARAVVPPPDGGYPNGNTAEGQNALFSLTTGGFNTAVGWLALRSNTENGFNTAVGAGALFANISAANTATGAGALLSTTVGGNNTADGALALLSNVTGQANTATGAGALFSSTTADDCTATGFHALFSNSDGFHNSAFGSNALASNTTGLTNTAMGSSALFANTDGNANTAVGYQALQNNISGASNTALGTQAGANVTTASGVLCLKALGANVNFTTWIGNVYGVTTQSGTTAAVIVSDEGQLGTVASSERFKKDIAAMDKASEAILSLRPVTFHYKTDTKGTPQFGLIAEEVAKVKAALVLPDKDGKPYSVRYDQVNAMLLNEFLKEHKKAEEQQATIAQLKKEMETVVGRLKEHESKIQRVSAHIELSKAVGQTALNNP
jgi:Chaperone of endosialidase